MHLKALKQLVQRVCLRKKTTRSIRGVSTVGAVGGGWALNSGRNVARSVPEAETNRSTVDHHVGGVVAKDCPPAPPLGRHSWCRISAGCLADGTVADDHSLDVLQISATCCFCDRHSLRRYGRGGEVPATAAAADHAVPQVAVVAVEKRGLPLTTGSKGCCQWAPRNDFSFRPEDCVEEFKHWPGVKPLAEYQ